MRGAYGAAGWVLRNARRAFRLVGWLGTGQFTQAGRALLPYYQAYTPLLVRRLVPRRLRDRLLGLLAQPAQSTKVTATEQEEDLKMQLQQDLANVSVLRIPGARGRNPRWPTILVCGHLSGKHLYGGERSFLDVLDGFAAGRYNVAAVIPTTDNPAYIDEIRRRTIEVVSFWYTLSRFDKPVDEPVVAVFEALVDLHRVNAVHVNTVTVREPLIAARRKKIPAVTNARVILRGDPWLCDWLGSDARSIIKQVLANADYIIANSRTTASQYAEGRRVTVVPNTVDVHGFDLRNDIDESRIWVGLISSNSEKKGVFDFAELAERVKGRAPNLRFVLVGSENQHTAALRHAQQDEGLYANLTIAGYVERPVDAVAKVNIVVNLSHFPESFGRTVLEGMAARRPVVAYAWGAIPELVTHGVTGYLVPHKDVEQAAAYLTRLAQDPSLITKMGLAGRKIAVTRYSKERFAEAWQKEYRRILADSRGKTNRLLQRR